MDGYNYQQSIGPRASFAFIRLPGGWRMGAGVSETFGRWGFALPVWQYRSQTFGTALPS